MMVEGSDGDGGGEAAGGLGAALGGTEYRIDKSDNLSYSLADFVAAYGGD
eukprot:SAG22_NODE_656_length_8099_cov_2.665500_6_plen_49_part_01